MIREALDAYTRASAPSKNFRASISQGARLLMTAQFAVDLLDATIEVLRPQLDRKFPIKQRIRIFWATARTARDYSASDIVQSESSSPPIRTTARNNN
jgi:hypothetical protein